MEKCTNSPTCCAQHMEYLWRSRGEYWCWCLYLLQDFSRKNSSIFGSNFTPPSTSLLYQPLRKYLLFHILLACSAFGVAIVMVPVPFLQTQNLALSHAWIGLAIMITMPLQGVLGWLADRYYKPLREKVATRHETNYYLDSSMAR